MDRFTTLLTLVLSLLKQPVATPPACEGRACAITKDIIAAVDDAPGLPFDGPAAERASDVLLLAVAFHESGLREDVQDCTYCDRVRGSCDVGRSMSMYQLMRGYSWMGHTKEQLCTDNRLASRLALRVLTRFSKGGPQAMFRAYAGCSALRPACRGAAGLQAQFATLAMRAGVEPAPRCGPRFYRPKGEPGVAPAPCPPAPAPGSLAAR